jgi:voltage-gated potassium channel
VKLTATSHHRIALRVIAATVTLDTALGLLFGAVDHIGAWNGLYFATTTASTVGYGDITPQGWAAHVVAILIMVTVVPLLAATFSLFTSGLTSTHVTDSEQRIKQHIEKHVK